jgi:hypothetical protein
MQEQVDGGGELPDQSRAGASNAISTASNPCRPSSRLSGERSLVEIRKHH